jgi:hypothetical protein
VLAFGFLMDIPLINLVTVELSVNNNANIAF